MIVPFSHLSGDIGRLNTVGHQAIDRIPIRQKFCSLLEPQADFFRLLHQCFDFELECPHLSIERTRLFNIAAAAVLSPVDCSHGFQVRIIAACRALHSTV
jgi:hypothetical protein